MSIVLLLDVTGPRSRPIGSRPLHFLAIISGKEFAELLRRPGSLMPCKFCQRIAATCADCIASLISVVECRDDVLWRTAERDEAGPRMSRPDADNRFQTLSASRASARRARSQSPGHAMFGLEPEGSPTSRSRSTCSHGRREHPSAPQPNRCTEYDRYRCPADAFSISAQKMRKRAKTGRGKIDRLRMRLRMAHQLIDRFHRQRGVNDQQHRALEKDGQQARARPVRISRFLKIVFAVTRGPGGLARSV